MQGTGGVAYLRVLHGCDLFMGVALFRLATRVRFSDGVRFQFLLSIFANPSIVILSVGTRVLSIRVLPAHTLTHAHTHTFTHCHHGPTGHAHLYIRQHATSGAYSAQELF